MPKTYSEDIISAIVSKGIDKIFLVPGGGCMIMQDAGFRNKDLEIVGMHSEQSAVVAAEYYGRNSDCGVGVAMATNGPGVTNTITGITSAWLDSRAVVLIIGQVKTPDLKKNENIRHYGVQYVDTKQLFKGITKSFITLRDNDLPKDIIDYAIEISKSDRPGPVVIEVPLDLQSKINNSPNSEDTKNRFYLNDLNNEDCSNLNIQSILEKIISAERPVFLLGTGCIISGCNQNFIENFINLFKIPIANSWGSIELIQDQNQFYIGRPGVVGKRTGNILISNADLILSIGNRIDLITSAYAPEKFASQAKDFFVVDIDNKELKRHLTQGKKVLKMGAKDFIEKISDLAKNNLDLIQKTPSKRKEWIDFFIEIKKIYSSKEYTNFISKIASKDGWSTYKIIEQLSDLVSENTHIVTGSSGHCTEIFYSYFRVKKNQRIYHSNCLGSMGFALASGIGIACSKGLNKNNRLIVLETDGSFNTNPQELGIISNLNLPIDIFIYNNDGYLSIRNGQVKNFEGRKSVVDGDSGLGCADIELLAKAYKIKYKKISNQQELENIFKEKNIDYNMGPRLIEILCSKDEELIPKCMPQRDKEGNISSMPLVDMSPLLELEELKKVCRFFDISIESVKVREN